MYNFTGLDIQAFLRHLLRHVRGSIDLLWDRGPIHRRREVRDFLAAHPRLHVHSFPAYAPELNPAESVAPFIQLHREAPMKLPASTFVIVVVFLAACTSVQTAPPAARSELTPTGKLRVGLILSNQVLVTKDPQTGELRGVTVTLGKALAKRLGVPFEPVGYPNPALLVQSFGKNEWDIAFLAFDSARARDVEFSPAYMVVDNTYLVPPGSKVDSVEAADRPGVKIAVPERSAPDLFLSRNLKAAEIVRVPGGPDAAIDVLRSGRGDAYAENAHMLSLYADRLPGSRVLPGRYTVIQHAVATPKGKAEAAAFVKEFVEQAKRDGTVRNAIAQAGLRRADVATPATTK